MFMLFNKLPNSISTSRTRSPYTRLHILKGLIHFTIVRIVLTGLTVHTGEESVGVFKRTVSGFAAFHTQRTVKGEDAFCVRRIHIAGREVLCYFVNNTLFGEINYGQELKPYKVVSSRDVESPFILYIGGMKES